MNSDIRTHIHTLVDHLAPVQLPALETILHSMLGPLSRRLALAPVDDEPFTEAERKAVAEAQEWLRHNEPIPLEDVLADLGLTLADWEKMGDTPLPEENTQGNG